MSCDVAHLIYNLKVPLFGNNVDMCLFDCSHEEYSSKDVHDNISKYIALGELKGGIDPAGADEHWKTARSALERIYKAFSKRNKYPKLIFIGAAIEARMAKEIWSELKENKLANAANLTKSDQLASLCNWFVRI